MGRAIINLKYFIKEDNNQQLVISDDSSKNSTASGIDELYKRASYERYLVKCSVKVLHEPQVEEFNDYLETYNKEGRNCCVPIFKEYFKKNNRVFGEGVWSIANVIFLMRMMFVNDVHLTDKYRKVYVDYLAVCGNLTSLKSS